MAEVLLEPSALLYGRVHVIGEYPQSVAAFGLGPVKCDVGLAQKVGRRAGGGACRRGTDANADVNLRSANAEAATGSVHDAQSKVIDVCVAMHVAPQDREFVAAEAGDNVAFSNHLLESTSDFPDQVVTGRITERVVKGLEPVEVEIKDSQITRVRSPRALPRVLLGTDPR